VLAIAMIETAAAMENLEEILATPELDAIYVGPADLSYALTGRFGFDHTEPPLYNAVVHIAERAHAYGVVPGIHCGTPAYASRMLDLGYRLVTAGADAGLLAAGAKAAVTEVKGHRDAKGRTEAAGPY